jgi:hypothetical protein
MAGEAKKARETKELVEDLARTVVKVAQEKAPVVTGELKASIDILSVTDNEAVVGHKLNDKITVIGLHGEHIIYPIFVHEGTAPHVIEPKAKKALAWGKGDNRMVRRRVYHPGTKAQPYFTAAIESPEIDKVMSKHGNNAVKKLSLEIEKSWSKQ